MKKYTRLFQPAGLVHFQGADVTKFLQGQTTCDVSNLTPENGLYGAFCNPKGRIKTTFLIIQGWDDDVLMLMDSSQCDYLESELAPYMAFFKADYEIITDDVELLAVADDVDELVSKPGTEFTINRNNDTISIHFPARYPRHIEIHKSSETIPSDYVEDESLPWRLWNITDGLVWVNVQNRESFLPHDVDLPLLGGVDFEKGCYTGQEIVARMHYRGDPKYGRGVLIMDQSLTELPAAVSQVTAEGVSKKVGQLVDMVATEDDQTFALVTIKKDITNLGQFQLSINEETSILCNVSKPNLT